MPKQLYSRGLAKLPSTYKWRVEWRDLEKFETHSGYYRTKFVAILDAYWRVLITPGWNGEVVLFDQSKGE